MMKQFLKLIIPNLFLTLYKMILSIIIVLHSYRGVLYKQQQTISKKTHFLVWGAALCCSDAAIHGA
jgi:hypothetical protein